jgi:integrase
VAASSSLKKFEKKLFRYAEDNSLPWHVKLQQGNIRKTFSTKSTVKSEAANKAREIYIFLRANGMKAALAKYGSGPAYVPTETIGQLIDKVEKTWLGQTRTVYEYAAELRRVASDIMGFDRSGHAGQGKNREKWLAKVNAIRIADITRDAVEQWRADYIKRANGDVAKRKAAETTSNTILRQCKAMFSTERLEKLGLADLPNPFAKVKLLRAGDHRFVKSVEATVLLAKAADELTGKENEEAFKALLLCLTAGLRRGEADKLEWSAFNFDAGTLHVGVTHFLHPKSDKSIGTVELEPQVVSLFRGWSAKATSTFVLESEVAPKTDATFQHYRCQQTFEKLAAWLRGAGVKDHSPIHGLRKLYGSLINDKFGLHASSLALRHANVATTAAHYTAKRTGVLTGLGSVLAESSNVIPINKKTNVTKRTRQTK